MNIKPVLVALMVAAATPAMAADQMPEKLIGGWCWTGDPTAPLPPSKNGMQVSVYRHGLCPDNTGTWMKVTKDSYEGQDGNAGPHILCKLIRNLSHKSSNSIYGKFHCYLYGESLDYENNLLRIENNELTLYEHSQHE